MIRFCCITTNKDVCMNFRCIHIFCSVQSRIIWCEYFIWVSCKWIWLYYNLWYWLWWHSNWICWGNMIHQEMKRIEYCPSMIVCHFTFKTVDQRFLSLSKICCFNCLMFGTRFSVESLKLLYLFEFMQMLHNGRMCSPHLIDRGWFNMKSWQM